MKQILKYIPLKYVPYAAWVQALVATLGSLYFSEIRHFTPCVLCWYQRIAMYPLVVIIAVGILRKDKRMYQYVLPLSLIGLLISGYHNLLYYKVIPESWAPCVAGVSCTIRFVYWFGWLSIPLLSFTAFSIITACMLIYRNFHRHGRS